MEEEKVIPNTDNNAEAKEDTTPFDESTNDNPTVSVKFNKEVRELSLDEAGVLAQKGMKYDLIKEDYDCLKTMAKDDGKSVAEFLEKLKRENTDARRTELLEQTGGNAELCDYIIKLESKASPKHDELKELNEMFPEINEIGELPEEVIETSKQTGKNLLDSYLRYLFSEKLKKERIKEQEKATNKSGVGSLNQGRCSDVGAANREFLKGLWGM